MTISPALPAPGWPLRVASVLKDLGFVATDHQHRNPGLPFLVSLYRSSIFIYFREPGEVENVEEFARRCAQILPRIVAEADAEGVPVEFSQSFAVGDPLLASLREAVKPFGFFTEEHPLLICKSGSRRPVGGVGPVGHKAFERLPPYVAILADLPVDCMLEVPGVEVDWPQVEMAIHGIAKSHGATNTADMEVVPRDPLGFRDPLQVEHAFDGAEEGFSGTWLYRWQGDGFVCTRRGALRERTPSGDSTPPRRKRTSAPR